MRPVSDVYCFGETTSTGMAPTNNIIRVNQVFESTSQESGKPKGSYSAQRIAEPFTTGPPMSPEGHGENISEYCMLI